MGEPERKEEEINVVDEFLSEEETTDGSQEGISEGGEISNTEVETSPETEAITENLSKEEFQEDHSEVETEQEEIQVEEQSELREPLEMESTEPLSDEGSATPISKISTIKRIVSEENDPNRDEILEKLKFHHGELTLLMDALEREVLENKKLIANQQIYIAKMENDVLKFKSEAEETMKNYQTTKTRLAQAEKKLDIVKRELLD